MRLTDSHAHLDFRQFDADRGTVIERAREAGVVAILNAGADLRSSRAGVDLAQEHDFIYAAVGFHPHDAKTLTPAGLQELRRLCQRPKVVAVGEIGLDYYRDRSPRPVQREAFEAQLALAEEVGLPVIVHSRDAHQDTLEILEGWKGTGVLHSYSGGMPYLERVLALGFSIGISGPVTFRKADQLREVVAQAPLDRILVETDCPYLTPEPFRGRRNEPAYTQYILETIARARGVSTDEVAEAAADNLGRWVRIL